MEEALRAALMADAGVTALVAARVTWVVRTRRGKLPAVVLNVAAAPTVYGLRGRVATQAYLVQIDCWAGTAAEALGLRRVVDTALDALSDPPLQAFLENERSDVFDAAGPEATGPDLLHLASRDARIWWTPS